MSVKKEVMETLIEGGGYHHCYLSTLVALLILTLLGIKSTWIVSRICWLSRTTATVSAVIAPSIEAEGCVAVHCFQLADR